jgi:ribosome-binding protein aMBF1 (putative translation factor)
LRNQYKAAREALGLTLEDVAAGIGYAVSTINNVENGAAQPSGRLRDQLDAFLKIKTDRVSEESAEYVARVALPSDEELLKRVSDAALLAEVSRRLKKH